MSIVVAEAGTTIVSHEGQKGDNQKISVTRGLNYSIHRSIVVDGIVRGVILVRGEVAAVGVLSMELASCTEVSVCMGTPQRQENWEKEPRIIFCVG